MRKGVMAAVALACILAVSAAAAFMILSEDEGDIAADNEAVAVSLIYDLSGGEYGRATGYLSVDMTPKLPAGGIGALWEEQTGGLGDFQSVERLDPVTEGGAAALDLYCAFEGGGKKVRMAFDGCRVSGISFEGYDQDIFDKIPDGLREVDVKVNAGGKWELSGKITTNAAVRNDVAVIIVHGSGAHDMDLTLYENKVYQDLSWRLAGYGIDVLRYDKRTYVYKSASYVDPARATVVEEVMDDAVAAAELMRGLGYERVFLIGHSLGGLLAPAIVREGGGLFNGFVSLAGSPRTLSEIQADQVLASATPEESLLFSIYVAMELAKLGQLDEWTEPELLSGTVFGYPAYYVKDMVSRDAGEIALSLDVPMLFLQGGKDFQVYPDKDFGRWKEILDGKEGAEFKLYSGLNHLFMVSQGPDAGTMDEYRLKGHVSPEVVRDIAEFLSR